MRSSPCGSLSTLLMTCPLAAIPLMAILGVPEFAPVAASTAPASREVREDSGDDEILRKSGVALEGLKTELAPLVPTSVSITDAARRQSRSADLVSSVEFSVPSRTSIHERPTRPGIDVSEACAPTATHSEQGVIPAQSTSDPLLFDATKKLEELGIHCWHMVRHERRNSYLFFCQFSSTDDPRVVQHFEAEATSAGEAAQMVVRQIDRWQASLTRF